MYLYQFCNCLELDQNWKSIDISQIHLIDTDFHYELYPCTQCDRQFAALCDLSIHVGRKHKVNYLTQQADCSERHQETSNHSNAILDPHEHAIHPPDADHIAQAGTGEAIPIFWGK